MGCMYVPTAVSEVFLQRMAVRGGHASGELWLV